MPIIDKKMRFISGCFHVMYLKNYILNAMCSNIIIVVYFLPVRKCYIFVNCLIRGPQGRLIVRLTE